MQFLKLDRDMRLTDLSNIIGQKNLDSTLSLNNMERLPSVSESYNNMRQHFIASTDTVSFERKMALLNQTVQDSELFEIVALQDEDSWKLFSSVGTLDGYLRIPDTVSIPNSSRVIGDTAQSVSKVVYTNARGYLKRNMNVNPEVFNQYSATTAATLAQGSSQSGSSIYTNFKIPIGLVSLYSSLAGEMIDFPVYPTELSDGVKANYDTMPDMLFQYEPWQIYKSSGPRTSTLTFDMHRDMWTGDHRDGMCNKLIRFCEANCYPKFNGAAVHTSLCTMYIAGKPFITGVITDATPKWDTSSPIGLDGFYLHVQLSITFTEVSEEPLNFDTVRRKGLIG